MKAPLSWINEFVDLPEDVSVEALTERLTALGLKLEALENVGAEVRGPLVIGRVLSKEPEPQKNGKTINWCGVDVGAALNAEHGTGDGVGIVCGAHNFEVGDLVVVVLPGGVLPGGFEISARKTYGHVSTGMICSSAELGLGEDTDPRGREGIIVLPADAGEPGEDVTGRFGLREDVIEFEINPDRAYALSLRGVAREAALGFDAPFTDPAARTLPDPNDRGWPVRLEDPTGCAVFATRSVVGFDPSAPTPRWLARRVQLAGMRPISLAVDVTNYVMLELGQPIHGYDADKLAGPIRVRRATAGESLRTLDGVERKLDAEDLVIADDSGAIGLAGVMGGETTELSETTTRVVIEAAHFDPVTVFRTQRRHKLPSEASKRFERGVDPTLPAAAADRVAELLVRFGGGWIEDGVTLVGSVPPREPVRIDSGLPARITGMEIAPETTRAHLVAIGCTVRDAGDGLLEVVPPPWRNDITDPFDLVEEVARIVGYEAVPSVVPAAPAGRGLTAAQALRRRVGRTLAGAGLVEVITFPFVGEGAFDALGLDPADERRNALELANPLSREAPLMTTTLVPALLETLARNVGRGAADVALFETATVTLPGDGAAAPILPVDRRPDPAEWAELQTALPRQPLMLAVALAGDRDAAGWWGEGRPVSWADAIEAVRAVAAALGLNVSVRNVAREPWHPGRCAEVSWNGTVIGYAGELHPRVCRAFGVPPRTAVAEIDLDLLIEGAVAVVPAPALSAFPVAKEDVALVVGEQVPAAEVAATLAEGAGELCESVRLFDVYTGEQIEAGKRSLAFALRFRAPDRTLTEAETGAARAAAVALAESRHGAIHRS